MRFGDALNISKQSMKNLLFSFWAVFVFICFITSCDESPVNADKQTLKDLFGTMISSEDDVDMVLFTKSGINKTIYLDIPDSNMVTVFAYITDGYDFVNPSSVVANNEKLENMDNYEGQFMGLVNPFPAASPYNISWNINGWKGMNYNGIQEISNPMDYITPLYLDTVSSAQGFSITYTGAANVDSVSVSIVPAAENFAILGMTSFPSVGVYHLAFPDKGSIWIPASILSTFPNEIYYEIHLTNYKSSSETFKGRNILKHSLFSASTCFYLIQ